MLEQKDVSLDNLAGGAVVERFNDALAEVLTNILDPNTTLAKRAISLKVEIKPDENRDFGAIDITCKTTLAPSTPLKTKIYIGRDKTGPVATEYNPQQLSLPEPNAEKTAITQLRSVGGQN